VIDSAANLWPVQLSPPPISSSFERSPNGRRPADGCGPVREDLRHRKISDV